MILSGMFGTAAQATTPPAAVTWNPSDKDSGVALSGGNLIATKSGTNGYSSVRATSGKSLGLWEFTVEVTGTGTSPSELLIGVMDGSGALNDFVGADANGYGKDSVDNNIYNNNIAFQDVGYSLTVGDRLTVYLDLFPGVATISFALNGGTPSSAKAIEADIPYFPAATVTKDGVDSVTLDCLTATTYGTTNGYALWT